MTRIIATVVAASAMLAAVTDAGVVFDKDFVNGFETGVFVRDDPKAYKEYSCEKPKATSGLAQAA